jgi:hypothetical protein
MLKTKNIDEINIAREYLSATKEISFYSSWMVSYGEYEFKNKELGKLIGKVRNAFYHDGSQKAIDKFWRAYNELKAYLN